MNNNVAIYVRVSSEEQVIAGISIDAQLNELREYAKLHKYNVYKEYVDKGFSGGIIERPSLQELLKDATKQKFSIVLFVKLDRWFRSVPLYYKIQEVLEENNINWVATQEDYETITSSGKFKVNIMLSVSQQFKDATSERIKSVFNYKVAVKKEAIHGRKIYGYDVIDKHYVVNPIEAKMLNEYFDEFIRTNNLLQCAYWWWENIGQLDRKHLRKRLTDRRLIGEYNYKGTIYYDYFPPIIDKDKFDKVQEILKINIKSYKGNARKRYYIYSGLVKCDLCGGAFAGTYHRAARQRYYRCNLHTQHRCKNPININEKELEQIVLKEITKIANDNIIKLKTKEKRKKETDKTPQIKEKINRLNDLYIEGMIDKDNYNIKLKILNDELDKCKPVSDNKKELYDKIISGTWKDIYNKLDNKHKTLFNRNIIKRITIKDRENIVVELVD